MEIILWNVCFQRCLAAPTNLSTYSNGVSRFDFELIFNNKVNTLLFIKEGEFAADLAQNPLQWEWGNFPFVNWDGICWGHLLQHVI